jgi:lipopolysaccharide/colanic/teichoic acid biosynthesis glycosyltransferase
MPTFDHRHVLRPGITGWAQVQAGYAANETETREKLSFDLYYVKYASGLLDLQILLRTFLVLAGFKEVR